MPNIDLGALDIAQLEALRDACNRRLLELRRTEGLTLPELLRLLDEVKATLRDQQWKEYARRYDHWFASAPYPRLVGDIFLVEVYAAGPDFLRRRITTQETFANAVAAFVSASTPQQLLACEALVGAVVSMATARIAAGDITGLTSLRTHLGELVRHMGECLDGEAERSPL